MTQKVCDSGTAIKKNINQECGVPRTNICEHLCVCVAACHTVSIHWG